MMRNNEDEMILYDPIHLEGAPLRKKTLILLLITTCCRMDDVDGKPKKPNCLMSVSMRRTHTPVLKNGLGNALAKQTLLENRRRSIPKICICQETRTLLTRSRKKQILLTAPSASRTSETNRTPSYCSCTLSALNFNAYSSCSPPHFEICY